jgi:hypothetical protein
MGGRAERKARVWRVVVVALDERRDARERDGRGGRRDEGARDGKDEREQLRARTRGRDEASEMRCPKTEQEDQLRHGTS